MMWSLVITIVLLSAFGGQFAEVREIPGFTTFDFCSQAKQDYYTMNDIAWKDKTIAVCVKKG